MVTMGIIIIIIYGCFDNNNYPPENGKPKNIQRPSWFFSLFKKLYKESPKTQKTQVLQLFFTQFLRLQILKRQVYFTKSKGLKGRIKATLFQR